MDAPQPNVMDGNEAALLRTAAVIGLLKSEFAMRVGEDGRYSLFFPSRVRAEAPAGDEQEAVLFKVWGAFDNIFAALVVRLARSGLFQLSASWRRRALFTGPSGETCALTLRQLEQDSGEFIIGFDRKAVEETRIRFEEYVSTQLRSRASSDVQRQRRFYCPSCGEMIRDGLTIRHRREEGHTDIPCMYCGTSIPLLDSAETADGSQHAIVAEMNRAADTRRDLDVAALVLRGKTLARDYDVFLSYAMNDRAHVDELDARLREQGILSWPGEVFTGESIASAVREAIEKSKAFVVVVVDSELSQWQISEMGTAVGTEAGALKRRAVVLIGRAEKAFALPELLPAFPVIDLREFTPAAMVQLIEVITGEGGKYIDPNAARLNLSSQPQQRAAEKTNKKEEEEQQHIHAGVRRFNRKKFFDEFVKAMSKLNQSQLSGFDQLLGFIEQDEKVDDVRAAAFILALVQHETANAWHPIADYSPRWEFQKYEPNTAAGRSLGNTQSGDGYRFRGRGYIQITGRANYKRMGDALGLNLISHPNAALDPAIAYRITSEGLYRGMLSIKKRRDLTLYSMTDYRKLLRTFGITAAANDIIKMSLAFETLLRDSLVTPYPATQKANAPATEKQSRISVKKSARASTSESSKKSSQKPSAKRPQPKRK